MKLTTFTGGLNLRLAPHLVPPEQGVIYTNIDNSKGHFTPMRHKTDVTSLFPALGVILDFGFYFDIGNEGYTTATPNDWVVYKEDLYRADRVGRLQLRISGGVFQQLGIVAPAPGTTLTGVGTIEDDPLSYAITYFNSVTGAESAPIVVGSINRYTDGIMLGSLPASPDTQVTHIRIYRLGGAITTYSRVAQVLDTANSFLDNLADDEIDGSILTTLGYAPSPVGAKYLVEYNSMLFAADGDKLRFTPIGIPSAWPEAFYLDMPNTITGIGKTPVGLLVFTRYKTILVTGTGPTTLAQQNLTDDQGCLSHDGIVNIKGKCVWPSLQGICTSDGSIPVVVSKNAIGVIELSVAKALEFNEAYYLHLGTTGELAVFDFAFGEIYKRVSVGDTKSLVKVNDKLYALGGGKLWDMFSSSTMLTARYKSGWLADGGLGQPKNQDRLRIAYTGNVTLKLYVNGAIAFTKAYSTVKAVSVEENKIAFDKSKNYFIEVELEGTGQVFEVDVGQYSANA